MRSLAIVTGGLYEGLSLAIACKLAREGFAVAILHRSKTSRPPEHVEKLASAIRHEFESRDWPLRIARWDESEACSIESKVSHLEAELGPASIVISGEGTNAYPPKDLADFSQDDWSRAVQREVTSELSLIRSVLPSMRRLRRGTILTLGFHRQYWENHLPFRDGHALWTNNWPFVLGKSWRKSIMSELAASEYRFGITMNSISPGRVRNLALSEILAGPPVKQDDITSNHVAAVAHFLCSEAGRVITGADVPVLNVPYVYSFSAV
jgi:NAD(P)-dependent dehydrogenase (short-subunit alcohol dehydrogenase family)